MSETQQQVQIFLEKIQKKVGPVISVTCPEKGVVKYGVVYLIESAKKQELIEFFNVLATYSNYKDESQRLLKLLRV